MRICALVVLMALAGCGTTNKLTACKGPTFRLNEDKWGALTSDADTLSQKARSEHE
ncbi:type IV secretion system protein VirB7 [Rhizobium leguminosarum]|nr:type IV secretion system protein VirB7 [Rhizobium leguminosarum]TBG06985.1 type IV secretion system protein VirB7 [Rhizobium leguminosarum]TBG07856.1 type IV secretion system protein VirB7 [Rhizobium leguminosarum]TBG30022.1 type IV secretion system protein VirB7 [Rhizobium leguminosarum]TBG50155.1 type IV secretion system protein VirB7 [Rhizobium leguminosarum]